MASEPKTLVIAGLDQIPGPRFSLCVRLASPDESERATAITPAVLGPDNRISWLHPVTHQVRTTPLAHAHAPSVRVRSATWAARGWGTPSEIEEVARRFEALCATAHKSSGINREVT